MKKTALAPLFSGFFLAMLLLAGAALSAPAAFAAPVGYDPYVTPTQGGATITGEVDGVTSADRVGFYYGGDKTNLDGLQYPNLASTGKFSLTLSGLGSTARIYYYQLRNTNNGTVTNLTTIHSFTTLDTTPTPGTKTNTQTDSTNSGLTIKLNLDNPLGETKTLPAFLIKALDGAILLLTPVVVIMLLYTGFLFVVARGNSEKLTAAKQALMYALIGAAIVLGAKGLALVMQSAISCIAGAPNC